jgi:hypothetical protein
LSLDLFHLHFFTFYKKLRFEISFFLKNMRWLLDNCLFDLSFFFFFGGGGDFLIFFVLYSYAATIVPTDAGIERTTVATGALAVRRSNH